MSKFDFLNEIKETDKTVSKNNDTENAVPKNEKIDLDKIETKQKKETQPTNSSIFSQQLDQHLNKIREEHKYDPLFNDNADNNDERFKSDHYIWKQVLKFAEKQDNETYNLLHYLRCAQCKLKLDRNQNDQLILKLDLDNSKYLLEMYMTEKELGKTKKQYKQMKLLNAPRDRYDAAEEQRRRNIELEKRKEELAETAKKRVLEQVVMLNVKKIKLIFDMMKPLLRKAENDVGVLYFNLTALNNYLKHRERGIT